MPPAAVPLPLVNCRCWPVTRTDLRHELTPRAATVATVASAIGQIFISLLARDSIRIDFRRELTHCAGAWVLQLSVRSSLPLPLQPSPLRQYVPAKSAR
jgi:hypothetical protein